MLLGLGALALKSARRPEELPIAINMKTKKETLSSLVWKN